MVTVMIYVTFIQVTLSIFSLRGDLKLIQVMKHFYIYAWNLAFELVLAGKVEK